MRYTTMGLRYFGVLLALIAAAALAVGLLALVGVKPAEAAFPGPNGNIAFTSSRDSNNLEIYSMPPIPSSTPTNLTNTNPGGGSEFQASFNHDGTRIAFVSNRTTGTGVDNPTGDNEIFVMDSDGTDVVQFTKNSTDDGGPAFSPNGKIAFNSNRDGNFEIYVMDATDSDADGNGDNVKRLTANIAADAAPAFSPDGTKIAFQTNRDDNLNIYLMKAVDTNNDGNGDDLKRLTKNAAADTAPSFSPSGTRIAFTSERAGAGNNEVYVMKPRPEGRKNRPKNLTKNAASDRQPAFSPDGTMIAFTSARDGNDEIYRMKADGTSPTRLTTNTAVDSEPDWGVLP